LLPEERGCDRDVKKGIMAPTEINSTRPVIIINKANRNNCSFLLVSIAAKIDLRIAKVPGRCGLLRVLESIKTNLEKTRPMKTNVYLLL